MRRQGERRFVDGQRARLERRGLVVVPQLVRRVGERERDGVIPGRARLRRGRRVDGRDGVVVDEADDRAGQLGVGLAVETDEAVGRDGEQHLRDADGVVARVGGVVDRVGRRELRPQAVRAGVGHVAHRGYRARRQGVGEIAGDGLPGELRVAGRVLDGRVQLGRAERRAVGDGGRRRPRDGRQSLADVQGARALVGLIVVVTGEAGDDGVGAEVLEHVVGDDGHAFGHHARDVFSARHVGADDLAVDGELDELAVDGRAVARAVGDRVAQLDAERRRGLTVEAEGVADGDAHVDTAGVGEAGLRDVGGGLSLGRQNEVDAEVVRLGDEVGVGEFARAVGDGGVGPVRVGRLLFVEDERDGLVRLEARAGDGHQFAGRVVDLVGRDGGRRAVDDGDGVENLAAARHAARDEGEVRLRDFSHRVSVAVEQRVGLPVAEEGRARARAQGVGHGRRTGQVRVSLKVVGGGDVKLQRAFVVSADDLDEAVGHLAQRGAHAGHFHRAGDGREALLGRVENLGRLNFVTEGADAAGDEDFAVLQQQRRVVHARRVERLVERGEGPGLRVEDFRAAFLVAADDEHAPVRKQRRGVARARAAHRRPGGERLARRIEDFGRVEAAALVTTARDEDAAVVQPQGGVLGARRARVRAVREGARRGVENLGTAQRPARVFAADDEHAPVGQSGRGVTASLDVEGFASLLRRGEGRRGERGLQESRRADEGALKRAAAQQIARRARGERA